MAIPRFTAEASLYGTRGQYRLTHTDQSGMGVAPARMSAKWCYWKDVGCTDFCGGVQDPEWRHECFMRCNLYLNNCLDRGVWTDKAALS
jgi:hypothetical protein